MTVGRQSHTEDIAEPEPVPDTPEISVCGSDPETSVFLESGNTDGWIASDLTVEIRQ